MKKSRYKEEQIVSILRESESSTAGDGTISSESGVEPASSGVAVFDTAFRDGVSIGQGLPDDHTLRNAEGDPKRQRQ